MPDELTPEQEALQEQLLAVGMNEQESPTPVHFALRAEIRRLQARVDELEGASKQPRAKRDAVAKDE